MLVALAGACEGDPVKQLRAATYPPDLQYITKQEIRTTMGSLAAEVRQLDRLTLREGGARIEDQARIVEILSRMRPLTGQLMQRGHSTHPRIDEHAPQLQRDVQRALLAAGQDLPNYYFAGTVAGSCGYCHAAPHPH